MMRQRRIWMLAALALALMTAACGGKSKEAAQLMETAYQQKDYQQMLTLADSLETAGDLTAATANYWRGYAYDRLKERQKAEDCWRASLAAAEHSKRSADVEAYVKSASRLANALSVRGDYEGTLAVAVPVADRLEALKSDTTSDYVNLLIYIGCCQAYLGQTGKESDYGFYRAYKKHQENVAAKHTDAAYKDAIAGLVNIAYYCVKVGKYEDALNYTRHFGELLGEYERRTGVDAAYVDRQLGRYDIYKAQALMGLGREAEAAEVIEAFHDTNFSQTPEGQAFLETTPLKRDSVDAAR